MRVASPARDCVEIDGITGRRYRSNGGMYDMHPADAKHIADIGGFIPGLTGVARKSVGYACTACGFRSWFTTCSRCGSSAERE